MQSKLHGNVVYHGVELLLLVSMLFCWPFNTLVCICIRCYQLASVCDVCMYMHYINLVTTQNMHGT